MKWKNARLLGSSLGCWMLACIVSAAPPEGSSPGHTGGSAASEDRGTSVHDRRREMVRQAAELRRETRQRLRHEARTEGVKNLQAIEELVDIYIALRLDRTLTDAERRRLAGKVRSRLIGAREDLVHQHDDPGREDLAIREDRSQHDEQPAAADRLAARSGKAAAEVLAGLSRQVLAQQGAAGPAGVVAGAAPGAAPPLAADYGQDLADLIQTVIAPSTWELSGGPGSLYYYRPLRVLVIRQTGEVHERIGGVIRDLRQAD